MPVGNVPDKGMLNSMLAQNAAGLRSTCDAIRRLWAYVGPIGAEALTGPPWNFDPGDAAEFYAAASELQSVAAVYFGAGVQAQARDYDSALAAVRGGA